MMAEILRFLAFEGFGLNKKLSFFEQSRRSYLFLHSIQFESIGGNWITFTQ
jgi:hypothetical protein